MIVLLFANIFFPWILYHKWRIITKMREESDLRHFSINTLSLCMWVSVIVWATFGHLQNSSLELNALKPCPIWITPD